MTDYEIVLAGTFVLTEAGSRAFGLDTEDSDTDLMGVCLEPYETVFGERRFESFRWRSQPAGVRSTPDDTDVVIYSLRKYLLLALAGNPTVLSLLFTPSAGGRLEDELKSLAPAFHSRRAAAKFIGYLISQRDKMTGARNQRTNRPELIEKYGWDVKFGSCAVRLGVTGVQFLSAGRIDMPMGEPWNATIRAIRAGEVSEAECLRTIETLVEQLKTLGDDPGIPAEPDAARVTDWSYRVHHDYWAMGRPLNSPAALKLADVLGVSQYTVPGWVGIE